MKKGFTLIELLAVIVILSIIALIATPIVIGIINNTKESSTTRSLELYKESLESAVARYQLKTGHTLVGEYSTTDDGKRLYLKSDESKTAINGLLIEYNGSTVSCETVSINSHGKIEYNNCKVSNQTITSGTNSVPSEPQRLCKRATTLHTETCNQTSTTGYCSGAGYTTSGSKGTATITYGSLGTRGTLKSGDAFDCDVNGDGTYNATTERFYYVSGKDGDNTSDYVTLIYYNNTLNGVQDNTLSAKIAYYAGNNLVGPQTAITNLPEETDWPNITLTDTPRAMKNQKGGTTSSEGALLASFSYSGYAARLINALEIDKSCNTLVGGSASQEKLLDSCNYLVENTRYSGISSLYGYWIETVSSTSSYAYTIDGYSRYNMEQPSITYYYGVRPVIVISKSDISY